jgi:hypothetical protein
MKIDPALMIIKELEGEAALYNQLKKEQLA